MKRLIGTLALTACALALGCGGGDGSSEGSSEGMVWHLMLYGPRVLMDGQREIATPDEIQKLEDGFRALPSRIPGMERFEWGRLMENSGSKRTHCLLVTFKEGGESPEEYRKLRTEAVPEYRFNAREFAVHDATPHARTATRGHLRRVMRFDLIKKYGNSAGTKPEEIQNVEDAMSALPSKIPAIERLQWGTDTFFSTTGEFPVSPQHLLLLTFKDAGARDACLADPAYKEFEKLLKRHDPEPSEWEYVARGVRD